MVVCLCTDSRSVGESVGSHSDMVSQRPTMDVVCVIDLQHQLHLGHRKHALEDVRQACTLVHANLHHIQVKF